MGTDWTRVRKGQGRGPDKSIPTSGLQGLKAPAPRPRVPKTKG